MIYDQKISNIEQSFERLEMKLDKLEYNIDIMIQKAFRKNLYFVVGIMFYLIVSKIIDKF